jgi:outer membrane protein OmpA-like peptidoglycan-associated protein
MLARRSLSSLSTEEVAESPFWISYSDLMTGLMVLFMVVMAAALVCITQGLQQGKSQEMVRAATIGSCMSQVEDYVRGVPGVRLNEGSVVFGSLARFENDSSSLSFEQKSFIRKFVGKVLEISQTPTCKAFLKEISVEGFASQQGSYLHNLDLSTRRSERVLCTLLEPVAGGRLGEADRRLIQRLFVVGGYSFNASERNDRDSRRIELRLEFKSFGESNSAFEPINRQKSMINLPNETNCPIGDR